MLFFELFPLFMLLVCLVVGVWLFVAHQEAVAAEEAERAEPMNTEKRRNGGRTEGRADS